MSSHRSSMTLIAIVLVILGGLAAGQQAQKALTNDDVIAMVHKKLPESVIVSAIQAGPGKFNTSTNELIRLNAAGVTEKELNAMLAAATSSGTAPASTKGNASQPSDGMPASKSRMPRVAV